MTILLTNDDGYNAEGIVLLKKKLSKYGRVIIVAPHVQNSSKSVAITIGKPLVAKEEEKDVYSVTGTPSDCVCYALAGLKIPFDLCVSGCNDTLNVSYDALFSGTDGAALSALMGRIPAIAVSCERNFHLVDKYFDDVMEYIFKNNLLSKEYVLNVNFPEGDEVKGISLSSVYYRQDDYYFLRKEDGEYAMRNCQRNFDDDPESDCYHTTHGIISIAPLSKTYFHKTVLDELKTKIKV